MRGPLNTGHLNFPMTDGEDVASLRDANLTGEKLAVKVPERTAYPSRLVAVST